jgi:hypothetical protein
MYETNGWYSLFVSVLRERSMAEKAELSECADRAGAEVLGLKVEVNKVRDHAVNQQGQRSYVQYTSPIPETWLFPKKLGYREI